MNGSVKEFSIKKPMVWKAFREMPLDVQKEYVNNLITTYQIGPSAFGEMFGITGVTCSKYIKEKLAVKFPQRSTDKNRQRFLAEFCGSTVEVEDAPLEEKTVKGNTPPVDEPAKIVELAAPKAAPGMMLTKTSLSFSGPFNAATIADKLAALFEAGFNVTVNIEIEANNA